MIWYLVLIAIIVVSLSITICKSLKIKSYNDDVEEIHNKQQAKIKELDNSISFKEKEIVQLQEKYDNSIQLKKQELQLAMGEYEKESSSIVQEFLNTLDTLTLQLQDQQNELQKFDDVQNDRLSKLAQEYELRQQELQQKIDDAQELLTNLKAKQTAYMQEQLRQEEIIKEQDFYKLNLSQLDVHDVQKLRELQLDFSHKEAIDKLIWEVYYKTPFDALSARLLPSVKRKVCGIYKITSVNTGKAYIGQSSDVRERWRQHIKAGLTLGNKTNKLYQAMFEERPDQFLFELLEEVTPPQLNERESYYIDFYQTKEFGLNKTQGNS